MKLIMLDLDGTLVDTSQDITNALNYAGEPFALKKLTMKETIAMIGEGVTRLIEKACGEDKPDLRETVIGRFLDYYSAHLTDSLSDVSERRGNPGKTSCVQEGCDIE